MHERAENFIINHYCMTNLWGRGFCHLPPNSGNFGLNVNGKKNKSRPAGTLQYRRNLLKGVRNFQPKYSNGKCSLRLQFFSSLSRHFDYDEVELILESEIIIYWQKPLTNWFHSANGKQPTISFSLLFFCWEKRGNFCSQQLDRLIVQNQGRQNKTTGFTLVLTS